MPALAYIVDSQTTGRIYTKPFGKKTVFMKFKNTGSETWSKTGSNPVRLGTANPHDRASEFYEAGNAGWLSSSRIEMQEATVAPNQFATFEFEISCPNNSKQYKEYFTPVKEGSAWFTPDPSPYLVFDARVIATTVFPWQSLDNLHHWDGLSGANKTTDIPRIGVGEPGDPDYVPDGYYSAGDENTIKRQLSLMKDAGINLVVLDWNGHSSYLDTCVQKFIDVMESNSEYANMRWAIMMDNMKDWSQVQFDYLYYLYNNSSQRQKYDGKFLLLTFGNAGAVDSGNRFFHACMGANDSTSGWVYWHFETWSISPIKNYGGTVIARYDDGPTGQGPFPRTSTQEHDQNLDEGMFDSQYQTIKTAWNHATLNTLRIVFFNCWNEYHERISIFEPHEDRNTAGATSPAVDDTHLYDQLTGYTTELTS